MWAGCLRPAGCLCPGGDGRAVQDTMVWVCLCPVYRVLELAGARYHAVSGGFLVWDMTGGTSGLPEQPVYTLGTHVLGYPVVWGADFGGGRAPDPTLDTTSRLWTQLRTRTGSAG